MQLVAYPSPTESGAKNYFALRRRKSKESAAADSDCAHYGTPDGADDMQAESGTMTRADIDCLADQFWSRAIRGTGGEVSTSANRAHGAVQRQGLQRIPEQTQPEAGRRTAWS